MTKFLVVNDPHNSDRAPMGRTETYQDDIILKQEEAWEIAGRTDCRFILMTGDIFHRFRGPQISDALKVRLLALYQDAPCPIFAVAGNHDLSSAGVASLWERPFGVLAKGKALNWLSEATMVEDVLLIPRNWEPTIDSLPTTFKLDKAEARLAHEAREDDGFFVVMAAHASVLPPGQDAIYPHHNADKLPTDMLDVLICGHIHEDLGIHQLPSGCWYANIGSLARVERSKHNLERTPEVLTVVLEGDAVEFERHALGSARPAKDVFFEKEVVTVREIGDFAEALSSALELEETPLEELLVEYTEGQPEAVVGRLRQYLTEVRD